MKKIKGFLLSFLFVAVILGFSSCDSDDDNYNPNLPEVNNGLYVISNGFGSSYATISYYDFEKESMAYRLFENANDRDLGNLGQQMIAYGSKFYVSVEQSGRIYVLDRNCKILNVIEDKVNKLEPHLFDASNGKVYVTLFNGYLARIDTTTMNIDKNVAVGPNPEYVKVVNNKVYVANSGGMNWENGYNNTVSILDLDLTTQKTITVTTNPVELKTDKYNNLYLVSRGDYSTTIPSTLQQINTTTDEVTILNEGDASSIFPYGDKLYLLKKEYDGNWNPMSTIAYYDLKTKKVVKESFITDGTRIADISAINFDATSGNIFVSAANSTDTGDLYVFSASGKLKAKHDVGGVFPSSAGVCFVSK